MCALKGSLVFLGSYSSNFKSIPSQAKDESKFSDCRKIVCLYRHSLSWTNSSAL